MAAFAIERPRRWYAVRTKSHFERRTAADMSARGVEVYLPQLKMVRQWTDRRKELDLPLFPGYLFARIADTTEGRLAVLRSCGAVSILGRGGRIEAVPDQEVEAVERMLRSGSCLAHPVLREGTRVRVWRGPLKDVEGLLIRFRNQSRLVVSVELLNQAVSAEIDAADVEPVRRAACAG